MGSNTERGYGWAWRQVRDSVMNRDGGLCQMCLMQERITPASEVDHILAKARGGTDDEANLQAICRACHAKKTIEERSKA